MSRTVVSFNLNPTITTRRLHHNTSQLMLYKGMIAVCSEISTKQIHALCWLSMDFFLILNLVIRKVTIVV